MKTYVYAAMLCLLGIHLSSAQNIPPTPKGIQPYAPFDINSIDRINLQTGNLVLNIPLISYKEPGALPDLAIRLNYNADNWQLLSNNTPAGNYSYWALVPDTDPVTGTALGPGVYPTKANTYLSDLRLYLAGQSGSADVYGYYYEAYDDTGADHIQGYTNQSPNSIESIDGTGIAGTGTIVDSHGVEYNVQCQSDSQGNCIQYSGYERDRSNNTIITNYPTGNSPFNTGWTDPLNRTIPRPYIPSTPYQTFNYPGEGTSTVPYTFFASTHHVTTDFQVNAVEADLSVTLLDSVSLPDGTSWAFSYNTWGELISIHLPTGGEISYEWNTVDPTNILDTSTWRRVTKRTVVDGHGTAVWAYDYKPAGVPQDRQATVVTDPQGNDTLHVFNVLIAGSSSFTNETDYFEGAYSYPSYSGQCAPLPSAQNLVQSTLTRYKQTQGGAPNDPLGEGVNFFRAIPDQVKTVTNNGLVSEVDYQYDFINTWTDYTPFQTLGPYPFTHGNLLTTALYDYGQCAPGPLLRTTSTGYKWIDDTTGTYLAANLVALPSSVTVSGSGNNASTTYGYDESNGSPQGTFGNQTSVTQPLSGGISLVHQTVYNNQGMPIRKLDPKQNPTNISYQCSGSLPYQVTNALGQITQYAYDCNTGEMTNYQDPNDLANSRAGTAYHYDSSRRIKEVDNEVGSKDAGGVLAESRTVYTYPSATEMDVTQDHFQTGDGGLTHTTYYDGVGRPFKSVGSDGAIVEMAYDGLGRKCAVSNPTFTDPGPLSCDSTAAPPPTVPTDGITYFQYDALGRKVREILPDNNQLNWSYQDNVTDFHDANWLEWQLTSDALGRLTQVAENDPAGSGALNLQTFYTYDALDNLRSVTQNGNPSATPPESPRLRSFGYDGLSRLTSATNPESGTTTYLYAQSGGALCSGDPSNPCSRTDARGIVTTYSYDSLNRVSMKSYSIDPVTQTPTPTLTFTYDTVQAPPVANQNNWIGHVSLITSTIGTTNLITWQSGDYDSMGRDLGYQDCLGATAQNCGAESTAAYDYNPDSSLRKYGEEICSSQACPNAATFATYGYDNAGRLNSITSQIYDGASGNQLSSTVLSGTIYNAMGSLTGANLAIDPQTQLPGIALTRNYDNRLRITGETDTNSQQQTLYSYSLAGGYDGDSNVTGFSDSVMGTWSIQDDHLNRLYQGQATAGQYSGINFISQYDSFGNRKAYGYWGTSSASVPPQQTLTYNANNQITAIDNENNGSVKYDAAGNMTSDGINQYLYDGENRLCAFKTPQGAMGFLYDGKGYRISKGTIGIFSCDMSQNGNTTANGYTATSIYAVDLAGNQLEETNGAFDFQHGNVFLDGKVLATYSGSSLSQSNWHYSLNDWVGTKRIQASSTGTMIDESCVSLPFGDGLNCQGPGADATEHHFTGKERDIEPTLDYFPTRYYSSNMGRWMSPDSGADATLGVPVPFADLENPQSLNLYGYVHNNPLRFTDPDGHATWADCGDGSGSQCLFGDYNGEANQQNGRTVYWNAANGNWDNNDPTKMNDGRINDLSGGQLLMAVPIGKLVGPLVGSAASKAGEVLSGALGKATAESAAQGGAKMLLTDGTKQAAKTVVDGMADGAQKASVKRAVAGAISRDSISIAEHADGSITVTKVRPGADGFQAIVKNVDPSGASVTIQGAYDAEGNLVHLDPKN
jgi:RHS repeat-associated protein